MKSPKLTAKRRNSLPTSTFGLPSQRKYPMDTAGRAANAKARSTQAVKAGRMSSGTKAKIDAKANRVLGHGPSASPAHKKMTLKDVIGEYQRARKS